MSLRKTKMLLEHLKNRKQESNTGNVEQEEEEQVVIKKTNMFQGLGSFGNDTGGEQSEKQQIKIQNQDKKEVKGQKKKKKKKNKKKKQEVEVKQKPQDDFQKILKEAGWEVREQKEGEKNQTNKSWQQILEIVEKKFNYQRELRRHFRGWQQQIKQDDPQVPKKQQKMQKHLRQFMKKSLLSPGIKEYFPINEKFQVQIQNNLMKFVPTKRYDMFQKEYEAIRNTNDINALFMFTQTHPEHVDSLYAVGEFLRLQGNYREADTLIQKVIYIYEIGGGYQLADFIKKNFISKKLLYDVYSTSLFMSLFKFMDILGKKGCFKAALQYNKLLLKLNLDDPTACLLCLDYNAISSKQFEYLLIFVKDFPIYNNNYSISIQKQQEKQKKEKEVNIKNNENLYCIPNFTYSVALAKFMLTKDDSKGEKKQLVIQENLTLEALIQFNDTHWEKALQIKNMDHFIEEDAQTLIVRAIMLYPKLIMDIAFKNQYNKQYLNHSSFVSNQKKTYDQIMKHEFWSLSPDSYSYHFLRLENMSDSKGLDKILQIYVERSKVLWKSNQIMLWMKGALGFVLNQIEKLKFDYQGFLEHWCSDQNTNFKIPFQLRRYEKIYKGNFSDRVERVDLNNIQDNGGIRAPNQNRNPINVEGNPISLFLRSLLPWVNLPGEEGEEEDPDMPFIEEEND